MPRAQSTEYGWYWSGRVPWPGRGLSTITTAQVGRWGEWLALWHLLDLKWDVLARNWETRQGEVDLIARDEETLVFVEVKSRHSTAGSTYLPEENISLEKEERLERLALAFLQRHEMSECPLRLDLIAVETHDFKRAELRHFILW